MKYFSFVLVLALLLPVLAARAGEEPKADPFELWRKPDAPADNTATTPSATHVQAPPPSPAPSPSVMSTLPSSFGNMLIAQEKPRTEEPMEDYTQYYQRKQYVVDNEREKHGLTYFWKEPKSTVAKSRYPLVVILHDDKGIANAGEFLVLDDVQHDYPAFLAVPVLPIGQTWAFPAKFPEDPALAAGQARLKQALPDVVRMVNDLVHDNPIDKRRIYVVGCGEGGFGAFGAALQFPETFAAAVPVSGGWAVKESSKLTKVPLFILHGEQDKTFQPAWSRDVAFYVQQFGGVNVHYVNVPGLAHDCADKRLYSKSVWKWMFDQVRPAAKTP